MTSARYFVVNLSTFKKETNSLKKETNSWTKHVELSFEKQGHFRTHVLHLIQQPFDIEIDSEILNFQ